MKITSHTLQSSSGLTVVLSPDEYRLALLGLVDFEGHWAALQVAASLVVDAEAKARLIQERLLPIAGDLASVLTDGVDVFQMWMARHWFSTQPCRPVSHAKPATRRRKAHAQHVAQDAGAHQEDA